ncbi:TPA: hypothetical protein ACKP6V_002580 [Pseudomonas aeruginosa]
MNTWVSFQSAEQPLLGQFSVSGNSPDPLTGRERNLWRVRLGVALVMLLEHDLSLYYDPAPIARLQHGISQAVARHVLSHKVEPTGGWYVDTVIVAVAGTVPSKAMRDARFRLREDADELKALGLTLDGDRVRKKGAGDA